MSAPQVVAIPLGFVYAFLVIQDQRAVLVDTGLAGSATRILRVAARHSITPQLIKLIILTHGHTDHTGSASVLKDICQAPIALHPLETPLLARGTNDPLKPTGAVGRLIAGASKLESRIKPIPLNPDVLLEDGAQLAEYGIDAQIVHTPGHTPGSLSIITSAGDALIGDLLLIKPLGFGRPSYPFFIDDLTAMKSSIRRILDLKPTNLFAAHGGHLATNAVVKWFESKA
jgi:glyoxylase-like metal-dependent hydrolase (beta-lactamase superfamily II)